MSDFKKQLKQFVLDLVSCGEKKPETTPPDKFREDMRNLFNDNEMFRGELPTIQDRLNQTDWSK